LKDVNISIAYKTKKINEKFCPAVIRLNSKGKAWPSTGKAKGPKPSRFDQGNPEPEVSAGIPVFRDQTSIRSLLNNAA